MANKKPRLPAEPPTVARSIVIFQITDSEPIQKLLSSLARLHARMIAGELTMEQAANALAHALTTLEGETL